MSFTLKDFLNPDNYRETFPSELIFPALLAVFSALLVSTVVYFIKKPHGLAPKLASVSILSLFLADYEARLVSVSDTIRAFLPITTGRDNDLALISLIFLMVLLIISLHVGRLIEKLELKHSQLQGNNLLVGLLIIIGFIFASQAIPTIAMMPTLFRESSTTPNKLVGGTVRATDQDKPDIYYFVLDRYTNSQVLSSQFSFDNSKFLDYLKSNDFSVKDNAYSNYPYTAISMSSTMNGAYTNDLVKPYANKELQSKTLYHNLVRQSSVVSSLKESGYKYYALGSWYGISNLNPQADNDYTWDHKVKILGKTLTLRGFENIAFSKSVFYRFGLFSSSKLWPISIQEKSQINDLQTQISTLKDITTKGQPGGRFVFAHMLIPHEPFAFNSDGSLSDNPGADNIGKPNKQKYTDQIQFINGQMQEIVANIQKQSNSKAVIIFSSDEGAYPGVMNASTIDPLAAMGGDEGSGLTQDMKSWPVDWLKMKYGILQAVHIPNATESDLSQLSSVNVFRIVLNRYAGYSLPLLPDCNYGLTNGDNQYKYTDITELVQGQANPQCKQFQTVSN